MSKKALVLSSGGVDSTTCVSVAVHELGRENVATVSIFYGQKHRKELDAAQKVADFYHVPHYELDLSKIFQYSNCSLLSHSTEEIIHESYEDQIAQNGEGKVSTYVPFRNGLMLSAVASLAMSLFENSLLDVDRGIIEAAQAMGASYFEIIWYFLLPEAKGSLILSITTGTIGLLGATAMAGAIGAGGVGDLALTYGYERMNTPLMFLTVVILIIFVQIIQTVGNHFAFKSRNHE